MKLELLFALLHLETFPGLLGFRNGSVFFISYSKPNAYMYLLGLQSFHIILPFSHVITPPRVREIYSQATAQHIRHPEISQRDTPCAAEKGF